MAESSGAGVSVLSFIVGAILVAVVAICVYLAIGGHFWSPVSSAPNLNVKIERPANPTGPRS